MNSPKTRPNKKIRLLPVIMPLILGVLISQPVNAAEPSEPQVQNQSGSRAFIDPETGQLTSSPTPQQASDSMQLTPKEQNAMSTSHEGLTEEKIPGKGVRLDLQGRFQSTTFATVNDSGEVSVSHEANSLGEKQQPPGVNGSHHKQGESEHE